MAGGIRVLEEVKGSMRPAPHFRRITLPVAGEPVACSMMLSGAAWFWLDVMIASRKALAASVGFHASLYERPSI
jgi:hypothetical protein